MIGDNMMVTADNRSLASYRPDNPGERFSPAGFSTAAHGKLANGAATMDTLVALGTGVAWLIDERQPAAAAVPMEARHLYDEASAMIIRSDYLGQTPERAHVSASSKALEKLIHYSAYGALVTDEVKKACRWPGSATRHVAAPDDGYCVLVDGEMTQGEAWPG
ncbi:hypothetical protein ACNKHM_04525 [Shigella sonnei]